MLDHQHDAPTGLDANTLLRRYRRAKDRRGVWENHWRKQVRAPLGAPGSFLRSGLYYSAASRLPDSRSMISAAAVGMCVPGP